jgi:hypothetical protein
LLVRTYKATTHNFKRRLVWFIFSELLSLIPSTSKCC